MTRGAGRFAPSPSGDLHLGNLRTALLAWLFARSTGRAFLLRVEDLDRARAGSAQRQLADLRALGITHDGPVTYQSRRLALYGKAIEQLTAGGRTYECFCTRAEIQQAIQSSASAPHTPAGSYPGTCRELTDAERAERRREIPTRAPALRLRAETGRWTVHDELHGDYTGTVDDLVLRRGDGVFAYNLAVVLDDAEQGIDQVVRGDDLLSSSPRQAYLAHLLNLPPVEYAHVPLAVNAAGARLAKRDGAVTVADLAAHGVSAAEVLNVLAASLQLAEPGEPVTPDMLRERFDPAALPREPWVVAPATLPT